MSKVKRTEKTIPVDRVFLQLENPRHEPYKTQSEVIGYLCRHEHVLPLANDIVEIGLNPLERFAVLRDFELREGKKRIICGRRGQSTTLRDQATRRPGPCPARPQKKI